MPLTTLVVDLGTHSTGAAVVVGDQATLVPDPLTGSTRWPSYLGVDGGAFYAGSAADRIRLAQPRYCVEGPRRAVDTQTAVVLGEGELSATAAVAAFLGALRAEAARLVPHPLDRVSLAVPTSYPLPDRRRDLLIAAGESAGFPEVELVGSTAALLLDAATVHAFGDGALVLVCDLGETWSTTLVRIQNGNAVPIAQESAPAGREFDSLLLNDLRAQLRDFVEPILALPGEDGRRATHQASDFVRQVKHTLATLDDHADVTGRLSPEAPPYTLRREWLDRLMEPGLRWVAGSGRSLLARVASTRAAAAGPALSPLSTVASLDAVVLAGGHARLSTAERVLRETLQRPVLRLEDPDLAVVRGLVRFTSGAPARRVVADQPRWRVEPVAWDVPTGRARLERWAVGAGERYARGAVLAQVRTSDERVYELTAAEEGELLVRRGRAGDVVGPTLIASTKRTASLLAGDAPDKRQELTGSGEWLYTPDRQFLVECATTAELVRLWSIPDGVVVHQFRPELPGGLARRGRVFVAPDGRLSLVTWDPAGSFSVWDVRTGSCTTQFKDTTSPVNVLVNEREWRLSAEGEDGGSAGRYRRTVATLWDLATGRKLEKLTDDWHRRLTGYECRSVSDRFGENAFSPDGLLRAVPVASGAGLTGISLQETRSEHEVYRCEHPPSARVRVAFSADGHFLLANRESPQHSQVDVWEL